MYNDEELNDKQDYQYQDNLCQKCHQRYIDTSESEYSILCSSCREEQIKYPIPKVFIPIFIILILLVGISFRQFPTLLKEYKVYAKADEKVNEGYLSDTLDNLLNILKEHPDADKVAIKLTDIAMENGMYDYAGYILDKYLAGKEFDDDIYDKLSSYVDDIERYYETYDSCNEILKKAYEDNNNNFNEEKATEELLNLLNDNSKNKSLIYYCLGRSTEDTDLAKSYLEKSLEEDPKMMQSKVAIGNTLRRGNNFDEANKKFQEILAEDKTNEGALRGLAVLEMLKGNNEKGLQLAKDAYISNANGEYIFETLLIALKINNKEEDLQKYKEEFLASGYEFDDETLELLEGNTDLYSYYINE